MPTAQITPELLRLIDAIEEHVRAAAQLSAHPASEDTIKKNLRLLNVLLTNADKDFIDMLPEVNKAEARKLFADAREVFELYIEVYNQYLADRLQGHSEAESFDFARQTMQEEQQPLELA